MADCVTVAVTVMLEPVPGTLPAVATLKVPEKVPVRGAYWANVTGVGVVAQFPPTI